MSIQVDWQKACLFNVTTSNGSQLLVDAENGLAPCPTELLLSALGSCSATDVVLYLQEHGVDVEQLSNKLTYTLTDDEPRLYQSANLHFSAQGIGITTELLSSAAQQAVSHHCHVCLMLKPAIEISYSVEVVSGD